MGCDLDMMAGAVVLATSTLLRSLAVWSYEGYRAVSKHVKHDLQKLDLFLDFDVQLPLEPLKCSFQHITIDFDPVWSDKIKDENLLYAILHASRDTLLNLTIEDAMTSAALDKILTCETFLHARALVLNDVPIGYDWPPLGVTFPSLVSLAIQTGNDEEDQFLPDNYFSALGKSSATHSSVPLPSGDSRSQRRLCRIA
ncbi:hypothetical protein P7C70_g931, partial [Phenoliferia sp. Uapishka_3]